MADGQGHRPPHHLIKAAAALAGRGALALGVMAALWGALGAGAARADCAAPTQWQEFANPRFGVRIEAPVDCFKALPPPQNGDGLGFVSRDGRAEFGFYGAHNAEGRTPRSLKDWLTAQGGYEQLTYAPMGRNWLVLSGYRGEDIYYEKYILSHGGAILNAFWMVFPRGDKPVYSPIIERMEDSFRSGQGVDTP